MASLFDPQAFAVGMVALVNPCGFALLPAYLGFFLGSDDVSENRTTALNRVQLVGLSMTMGFLTVFGLLGLVFAGLGNTVQKNPWISTVIGIGLVILGTAMLLGFEPLLKLPKLERGTGSRSAANMYLFGVSYAVASLSCTIGLFLTTVGSSAAAGSYPERLGAFISYGLGMGLLATALTLMVAFGKQSLVNRFKRLLPRINMISAIILIVVGIYVALYGVWATQWLNGPSDVTPWLNSFILRVEGVQTDVTGWIDDRVGVLGLVFLTLNVGLLVAGFLQRNSRPVNA